MGRLALRNYCFVPTQSDCMCDLAGCGGVKLVDPSCPEHGLDAAVPVILNTHFHRIQGGIEDNRRDREPLAI